MSSREDEVNLPFAEKYKKIGDPEYQKRYDCIKNEWDKIKETDSQQDMMVLRDSIGKLSRDIMEAVKRDESAHDKGPDVSARFSIMDKIFDLMTTIRMGVAKKYTPEVGFPIAKPSQVDARAKSKAETSEPDKSNVEVAPLQAVKDMAEAMERARGGAPKAKARGAQPEPEAPAIAFKGKTIQPINLAKELEEVKIKAADKLFKRGPAQQQALEAAKVKRESGINEKKPETKEAPKSQWPFKKKS